MTHFRSQLAHLCVAASIVGDGAVSIRGQRDSQSGEHADSGNANAIKAARDALGSEGQLEAVGAEVAQYDGYGDGDDRDAGGDHSRTDTFDDNGSRARLASRCYLLGRLEAQRGVILRGLADDDAGQQTADDGERNAYPVFYLE